MSKIVELKIIDLAFDGKAVAKTDSGKIVFLNGGLTGETVRAKIVRSKRRFDEAIVLEILEKSDERIEAICRHFDHCGGCSWQDLRYQKQLEIKKTHVAGCIERIGGLENVIVRDIIGSVEQFGYRNKMEFSFNRHPEFGFTLGLHRRGQYADIFDLEECHLPSERYGRIVGWLREYVRKNEIPVYDIDEHTGYMRFLVIRDAKNSNELMINIVTNSGEFPSQKELTDKMTAAFPEITTIVHNENGQKANIAVGEKETVLYGDGFITEKLMGYSFKISSNSFFQTNTLQAENLYQIAFDMLKPTGTEKVLDLYCGTGAISICVAPKVAEVTGVELVADAITAAKENAEINNCTNVEFILSDSKDFLKNNQTEFDVVITDPPRAGMHPKALKQMISLLPEKILYISCNPSTFARDAKEIVEAGYNLPEVQPVDMFPHTRHIEMAALFTKQELSA